MIEGQRIFSDEHRAKLRAARRDPNWGSKRKIVLKKKKAPRHCADCPAVLTGNMNTKRCVGCQRIRDRALRRIREPDKMGSNTHRARKYGVAYEPINPFVVFDRDKWRCQICDVKTPKHLRGTYKP